MKNTCIGWHYSILQSNGVTNEKLNIKVIKKKIKLIFYILIIFPDTSKMSAKNIQIVTLQCMCH